MASTKKRFITVGEKEAKKKKRKSFHEFEMVDYFDRKDRAVPVNLREMFEQEYDHEVYQSQKKERKADIKAVLAFLEYVGYGNVPSPGRCTDGLLELAHKLVKLEEEEEEEEEDEEKEPLLTRLAERCAAYLKAGKGIMKNDDIRNLTLEQIHEFVSGEEYENDVHRFCELLKRVHEESIDPDLPTVIEKSYSDGDEITREVTVKPYTAAYFLARCNMLGIREHQRLTKNQTGVKVAHCTGKRYVDVVKRLL